MKYKILILTIMIFLIPKDTQASFVGTSPRQSANCTTGINCGLVGHWTFDGKDIVNGVIKDVSGNGNDGNTVNIASSTFYSTGKIGQAGNFDGEDDRVQTNSNIIGTNPVTVCAWIYPRGLGGSNVGRIVDNNGLVLEVFTSNRLQLSRDTNTHVVYSAVNTFSFNKWSHVCATVISNIANMYSNGVISGTPNQDLTTTVVGGSNLAIGNSPTVARAFNGIIDDVRIYNRVLSAQEIQQLYSMGAATKVATSKPVSSTCVSDINCGLVGYWTFDGKDISNGVILDKSGTGNNGNPGSIASSTFYTAGKMGQGARFDGVNDYIIVPDNSSIKPTGSMSWGGWTYRFSNGANQSPINKITTGTLGYMLYSGISSAQQCYGYGLTPSLVNDVITVPKNTWVHYMCVYDGSTLKIYRNGVLGNSTSVTGSITHSTNPLRIGSYGGSAYDGKADDLRVYNRALSAQEVQQLYSMGSATKVGVSPSATSTPSCSTGLSCGLVGYWTFDGKNMVNGAVRDMSGRGGTGYLSGISTSTFYAPGKIGQGGNFDGVDDYVDIADTNTLSFGNGTTDSAFSINLWIKPKIDSGAVLAKASSSIAGEYYLTTTGGAIYFRLVDNSTGAYIGRSIPITTGQWQQITAVYNGSGASTGISLFRNGILISSTDSSGGSYTAMENLSNTLKIGERDISSNHLNGLIDDVRVYNRALSAQEIQQLYSQSR